MKYNELSAAIKGPVFSRNDLALSGHKVLDYQLSLWVKKGYLVRLKNGIYAFSREKEKLRGEGIAFLLERLGPLHLPACEKRALLGLR
jgi:hypothetical protein